jgi:Domain of unknown function (DUF4136)
MKILAVCLLASVAFAQKVEVALDKSVDFSKFKTFAIAESVVNTKDSSLDNAETKNRINLNIQSSFEAKGLTAVQGEPPSLKVVYMLDTVVKTKVLSSPGPRPNARVFTKVPYSEGRLIIGLRTSQSLVWRSVARMDAEEIEKKLDEMVKDSIDKYPARPQ